MSFLMPLYLVGLAALSLPFIFHLVRRTPRGRQDFSSLMFLSPTPPRLTRRSRLDQLLLLAMRLGALALLAMAFARPFLREAAALTAESLAGRRLAILVDTSASMRRADLWQQALRKAEKELDELNPQDDVALYTFSDRLTTVVDFERERDAPIAGKAQVVRQQLGTLSPTWGSSDLGTALATVAGEIDSATDARQSSLQPQIVVFSDFQKGSRLEALHAFEWPKQVPVVLRPVAPAKTTNAFVHVLGGEEEGDDDPVNGRVRVVNAADSTGEQFYVNWGGDTGKGRPEETGVYVPAGQSRVVRLPRGAESQSADRLILRGDDHDFDNTCYVVPLVLQAAVVLYAGADTADEARGLLHFMRLALASDPLRSVDVRTVAGGDAPSSLGEPAPQLVVVSQVVTPAWHALLQTYVERGGTLLVVPANPETAGLLPLFFDDLEASAGRRKRERLSAAGGNQIFASFVRAVCQPALQRLHQDSFLETSPGLSQGLGGDETGRALRQRRSGGGGTRFGEGPGHRLHQRLAARRQPVGSLQQIRPAHGRAARSGLWLCRGAAQRNRRRIGPAPGSVGRYANGCPQARRPRDQAGGGGGDDIYRHR